MSKKHTIYKENLSKQEYFSFDVINLILGLVIIVVAVLALLGYGGIMMHSLVFLFGGFLMLLNMIKNINRKSLLAVAFGIGTLLMFAVFGLIVYYLGA